MKIETDKKSDRNQSYQERSDDMRYKIVLQKSEEGYSVSCPGLPGCWSQNAPLTP